MTTSLRLILLSTILTCSFAAHSAKPEQVSHEKMVGTILSFLDLEEEKEYIFQGTLDHPSYTIKRAEQSLSYDVGPNTQTNGYIRIAPMKNSIWSQVKALEIVASSSPIIKFVRLVPGSDQVISEKLIPLDDSIFVSTPVWDDSNTPYEVVVSNNTLHMKKTRGDVRELIIKKNINGSIDIESRSYFKTLGIKHKTFDFYNGNYSMKQLRLLK